MLILWHSGNRELLIVKKLEIADAMNSSPRIPLEHTWKFCLMKIIPALLFTVAKSQKYKDCRKSTVYTSGYNITMTTKCGATTGKNSSISSFNAKPSNQNTVYRHKLQANYHFTSSFIHDQCEKNKKQKKPHIIVKISMI